MSEGWKCPNCGGAHGPHVDSCPKVADCVSDKVFPSTLSPPVIPLEWYPPLAPAGDPPPMWPYTTCGVAVPADPTMISVN